MEFGLVFIIAVMLAITPVSIIISKTRIFRYLEDKFFEDHNHYM